jgi:CO/xanthine dehydrogenase FAD-binding subunit
VDRKEEKMFRNLPRFEYLAPKTVKECIVLLSQYGQKAKVIAGGTDLISQMKWGEIKPDYIISLSQIPNLDEIQFSSTTGLKLGALIKIGEIERSEIIRKHYPILTQAASVLGSVEIRNRGTVGGNLCNAAPSADMAPSLLVLGARVVIVSQNGEKIIPLEDFFVGPGKTILSNHEFLVRLEVPPMKPNSFGKYIKIGIRKTMDIAVVGVAALITLDHKNNTCEEARLGLGAVAPTPIRAKQAEEVLKGKKLNEEVIKLAAETASNEASPLTDVRASDRYRRDVIRALTRRAIRQALNKIKP